jgi:protocatechuate 3,4-dioxygenase beta subunit
MKPWSRVAVTLLIPTVLALGTPPPQVPAAPACGAGVPATPSQTEGPYFKANSPARASLIEPGVTGTKMVIEGSVLTPDCKPIARARLDFWQADAQGRYDNAGHRLRGHQFTDDAGRYRLETVVPGQYPGRTRHIHVKVQAPGQPALTTQVYLPDEPGNQRDTIFNPGLVMQVRDADGSKLAVFDFIIDVPPPRSTRPAR